MQVWTCPDKASVSEVFMYAITAANVQVPCPSLQQYVVLVLLLCAFSLGCFLHTLQLLASKLTLDRSLRVPKDGRVGIQLQSISAAHFFHLQKFLRKFETEIVDGSKTEPWCKLVGSLTSQGVQKVVYDVIQHKSDHAAKRFEWDNNVQWSHFRTPRLYDQVTQTILAPHCESSDCEFDGFESRTLHSK